MYDGSVSFYIMDLDDPVLAVYRRAFPGAFKDLSEISADLKRATCAIPRTSSPSRRPSTRPST